VGGEADGPECSNRHSVKPATFLSVSKKLIATWIGQRVFVANEISVVPVSNNLGSYRLNMGTIENQLKHLLDVHTGERAVVKFLAANPGLLYHYFVNPRGHCQYVLTEVSLGGDYYMDAVVLNGYSGVWEGYFIEFEPVGDKVFNKDGTPTTRIKGAQKQIADWREYMKLNPAQFRRKLARLCQTKDLLNEPAPNVEPCTFSNHRLKDPESIMWENFWIISGRRRQLSPDVRRLMARQNTEADIFIGSYDGFLDVAKQMNERFG
jgi:hypothetical protein